MRLAWQSVCMAVCALAMVIGFAQGQPVPPIPVAPAIPAVPIAPALPATPAAPAGFNIWTALCPPPGSMEKCKKHFCESFVGQMLQSMLGPVRLMSGGMMKPCCPAPGTPNPDDLKKPEDSAAGAAARIKKEEAEAKARRADVRYLGTVDCSRYPEAEKALIKALRTDRNECVRWEAALALGNGCCCTKGTIEALMLTVNGSDKDDNPPETSPRVKLAAAHALAHCSSKAIPDPSAEPPEKPAPLPPLPELKKIPLEVHMQPTPEEPWFGGFSMVTQASYSTTGFPLRPRQEPEPAVGPPTGQRGLLQIFMRRAQTPANNPTQ